VVDQVRHEPAHDPQDLERLLVSRERAGDVDGMAALYEPDAILDSGGGQILMGKEAIRAFYAALVAAGRKFDFGEQRPALISGNLALTSTRGADGAVTAEVARRQGDGTWLWVIDQFSIL
jgi:ketosteroid isomerase-like protein